MNGRIKLSGPLKSYLNWPITLSVLMIIMNIAVYFYQCPGLGLS